MLDVLEPFSLWWVHHKRSNLTTKVCSFVIVFSFYFITIKKNFSLMAEKRKISGIAQSSPRILSCMIFIESTNPTAIPPRKMEETWIIGVWASFSRRALLVCLFLCLLQSFFLCRRFTSWTDGFVLKRSSIQGIENANQYSSDTT